MIAPLAQDEQEASSNFDYASDKLRMHIPFQNENLCAELVQADSTRKVNLVLMIQYSCYQTKYLCTCR